MEWSEEVSEKTCLKILNQDHTVLLHKQLLHTEAKIGF
jgi:hypothetical protein